MYSGVSTCSADSLLPTATGLEPNRSSDELAMHYNVTKRKKKNKFFVSKENRGAFITNPIAGHFFLYNADSI